MSITALGELLVDFTPAGISPQGRPMYTENPGGAPANVLISAVRQGSEGALIACVGDDPLGKGLINVLGQNGIETSGIQTVRHAFTTLAFVRLDAHGERDFCFCRHPGADTQLEIAAIDPALITQSHIFHFGSLSLSEEGSARATWHGVDIARQAGKLISFDPNWRDAIWTERETGLVAVRKGIAAASLLKLSEKELPLATENKNPVSATQQLLSQHTSLQLAVVTLGAQGCYYRTRRFDGWIPGYATHAVDTTGAGDCFWGCVLASIDQSPDLLETGSQGSLEDSLQYACRAASLSVEKPGAMDSIPTRAEVSAYQCALGQKG